MEPQAYSTIKKVYDLLSRQERLSDVERSYLIGTLETLIAMYTEPDNDVVQAGTKERGSILDKLRL